MKSINIIIPVYNESKNIKNVHSRLSTVCAELNSFDFKFVFVNDGSVDESLEYIKQLTFSDTRANVVDLSRNFGKEIALSAGVHEFSDADAVICMDADLQHPPELIPRLIDEWSSGAEIVVTKRIESISQSIFRRVASCLYYFIMKKISDIDLVSNSTDFRLYDKKVIAAFIRTTERERMFRGIMDWLGFKKSYVEFVAPARANGQAVYSYSKLIKLAINSITAFSLWPLRLAGYFGIFITLTSGSLLLWMMANFLIRDNYSYTPLSIVVVSNTFFIGIVLVSLGLVALYIGMIHTEVMNRPLYIVREKIENDSSGKQ